MGGPDPGDGPPAIGPDHRYHAGLDTGGGGSQESRAGRPAGDQRHSQGEARSGGPLETGLCHPSVAGEGDQERRQCESHGRCSFSGPGGPYSHPARGADLWPTGGQPGIDGVEEPTHPGRQGAGHGRALIAHKISGVPLKPFCY
ncbi:hypothetical protein DESC_780190 [Desulfosarcina cetonica]|nr:hypothetical protein DESC_780190 [Desulfosarcina cetonica]